MNVPAEALAAACSAVGISSDHAGSGRYARALEAALPYVERAVLRSVVRPADDPIPSVTATGVEVFKRLEELG